MLVTDNCQFFHPYPFHTILGPSIITTTWLRSFNQQIRFVIFEFCFRPVTCNVIDSHKSFLAYYGSKKNLRGRIQKNWIRNIILMHMICIWYAFEPNLKSWSAIIAFICTLAFFLFQCCPIKFGGVSKCWLLKFSLLLKYGLIRTIRCITILKKLDEYYVIQFWMSYSDSEGFI